MSGYDLILTLDPDLQRAGASAPRGSVAPVSSNPSFR